MVLELQTDNSMNCFFSFTSVKAYLPTFSRNVGGEDPPLVIVVGGQTIFRIILYSPKDFEECVTCIKVLNYSNSLEKSMFKDKYLPLLYTVCLIKAIILIN